MGNEKIVGLNARVRDFWQFALSDLRMDNTRGHLDEFIVARALKLADARREWDAHDLLYGGITFEIKSSEYLQSWEQRNVSKIRLTGLKGTRVSSTGVYDPAGKTYNAMVHVFYTHITREHAKYDKLQLDHWEFDVVPRSTLLELNQASIGLAGVRRLSGGRTPWASLAEAVTAASQREQLDEEVLMSRLFPSTWDQRRRPDVIPSPIS